MTDVERPGSAPRSFTIGSRATTARNGSSMSCDVSSSQRRLRQTCSRSWRHTIAYRRLLLTRSSRSLSSPGFRAFGPEAGGGHWRYLLPLMPRYFRHLDLEPYDIVIASSHAAPSGAATKGRALRLLLPHADALRLAPGRGGLRVSAEPSVSPFGSSAGGFGVPISRHRVGRMLYIAELPGGP